jgi:hypothetical protein
MPFIKPEFETTIPFNKWPFQIGHIYKIILDDHSVITGRFEGTFRVSVGEVSHVFNNISINKKQDFIPETVFVQNHTHEIHAHAPIPKMLIRQGKPIVIKYYSPTPDGAPIIEFSVLAAIPRTKGDIELTTLSAQSFPARNEKRMRTAQAMRLFQGMPEIASRINGYIGDPSNEVLSGAFSHQGSVKVNPSEGGKRSRKRRTRRML